MSGSALAATDEIQITEKNFKVGEARSLESPGQSMFLNRLEIETLTGYRNPSSQIRWLTRNGIRHWVARTGRPQVPRAVIEGTGDRLQDDSPALELGHVS